MVSPELLRRYPFFSFMNYELLRETAMISDEVTIGKGETLFEIGEPANDLYILSKGCIHLHYIVVDEHDPTLRKDFMVGVINEGELVAISAMIEPYELTATAIAIEPSTLIKIDAPILRKLCQVDPQLSYGLLHKVAEATRERLHFTRVQLAAAMDQNP